MQKCTPPDPLNVVLTRYPHPDLPIWKTRFLDVPTMGGPTEPRSVSVWFIKVHSEGAHQSTSASIGESLKMVLPLSNVPVLKPLPLVKYRLPLPSTDPPAVAQKPAA